MQQNSYNIEITSYICDETLRELLLYEVVYLLVV